MQGPRYFLCNDASTTQTMQEESWLGRCFQRYFHFVARPNTAWFFLLLPLVLTIALGAGIGRLSFDTDLIGLNSQPPSLRPVSISSDITKRSSGFEDQTITASFHIPIFAKSANVNLLDEESGAEILSILDFIAHSLNYTVDGESFNFGTTACHCFNHNAELRNFFKHRPRFDLLRERLGSAASTSLTYPIATILGNKYEIYRLFHDVTLNQSTSVIERVGVISTLFNVQLRTERHLAAERHLAGVKLALLHYAETFRDDPRLGLEVFSDSLIGDELANTKARVIPLMVGAVMALALTIFLLDFNGDWMESFAKPVLSLLTAAMATLSTVGLLSFFRIALDPFSIFALILPLFLLVFLNFSFPRNRFAPLLKLAKIVEFQHQPYRSVLVVLAVFVLAFLPFKDPILHRFSLFSAVGIAFGLVYHWTFFYAALYLNANCIACGPSKKRKSQRKALKELGKMLDKMRVRPICRCLALLVYAGVTLAGFAGCLLLFPDFSLHRLFLKDSHLSRYFQVAEYKILNSHLDVEFLVLQSPDFRQPLHRKAFTRLLTQLHNSPFSFGPSATQFWFKSYEDYLCFAFVKDSDYFKGLKPYLSLRSNREYQADLRWNRNQSLIEQFRFKASFRDVNSWHKRLQLTRFLRGLCEEFPSYDIHFHHILLSHLVDNVGNVGGTVSQILGIASLVISAAAVVIHRSFKSGCFAFTFFLHASACLLGSVGVAGYGIDPFTLVPVLVQLFFIGVLSVFSASRTVLHSVFFKLCLALSILALILHFIPLHSVTMFSRTQALSLYSGSLLYISQFIVFKKSCHARCE